jgi:hypothetical protein
LFAVGRQSRSTPRAGAGLQTTPQRHADRTLRLQKVSELDLAGNRPYMRPSEWSMILARSYIRYLCREHDAVSGELLRRHRNSIQPAVLFTPPQTPLSPNPFEEQISSFGEYRP